MHLCTDGTARGAHRVVLLARSGKVLSQARVWLYPRSEPPRISVSRTRFAVGEPITVRWSRAPGMNLDWVSVFRCEPGGLCAGTSEYLVYEYTGNRVQGRLALDAGSVEGNEGWPLPPGRYVVRLLPDDGLRSVAQSARFTVTAR